MDKKVRSRGIRRVGLKVGSRSYLCIDDIFNCKNTGRKYGHLRSGIIVVIDSDYIWGYNDNAVLF